MKKTTHSFNPASHKTAHPVSCPFVNPYCRLQKEIDKLIDLAMQYKTLLSNPSAHSQAELEEQFILSCRIHNGLETILMTLLNAPEEEAVPMAAMIRHTRLTDIIDDIFPDSNPSIRLQ